jgi:hypothetical protein
MRVVMTSPIARLAHEPTSVFMDAAAVVDRRRIRLGDAA